MFVSLFVIKKKKENFCCGAMRKGLMIHLCEGIMGFGGLVSTHKGKYDNFLITIMSRVLLE